MSPFNTLYLAAPANGNKYELSQPLNYYDPEITPLNCIVFDVVLVDEIHYIGNGINTQLDN